MSTDDRYIHPFSEEIQGFVRSLASDSAEGFIKELIAWFDGNITYSRLNAPFFPLQRSDLDLLKMKCGTCGDFSNLIVSCLTAKGIKAQYALIKRDCYGDMQDHICAAALIGGEWKLIDATLPYRKWFGYGCPHREYELVGPEEFERRMREIENRCIFEANSEHKADYAGLLYAPWIHDEVVLQTENRLDSVFYLMNVKLAVRRPPEWFLFVTYMSYTSEKGRTPVMAALSRFGECYRFSVKEPASIWDPEQCGEPIKKEELSSELVSPELLRLKADMEKNVPRILTSARIIRDPSVIID